MRYIVSIAISLRLFSAQVYRMFGIVYMRVYAGNPAYQREIALLKADNPKELSELPLVTGGPRLESRLHGPATTGILTPTP